MSSFKKLNKADVTSVSYAANKRWTLSYTSTPNDSYATYYIGKNEPFSIAGSTTNSQYQSLVYSQINHLFYQSYTSSLNTGSLMFNVNTYQSASQQRPTSSYFNYNINPALIKQFPTGSSEYIGVISINQNIYGSKILPTSFNITSSTKRIVDDGNGNLYDVVGTSNGYIAANYISASYFSSGSGGGITFIGNIFYAHGLIVLTNQSYYSFPTTETFNISFQNEHIVYENEVRCIVKESDYNLSYNPSLVSGSYESGSLYGFATSASFYPYATTIGLYNDDNDLLMVAKLAKPIMMSPNTDMTFIVKYDT